MRWRQVAEHRTVHEPDRGNPGGWATPGSSRAGEPGPERRHACYGLKPNVRPQLRPTSLAASQLRVAAGDEALSSDRFLPARADPSPLLRRRLGRPPIKPAGDRIGTLAIAGRRDLLRRSDVPARARVGDPPLRGKQARPLSQRDVGGGSLVHAHAKRVPTFVEERARLACWIFARTCERDV